MDIRSEKEIRIYKEGAGTIEKGDRKRCIALDINWKIIQEGENSDMKRGKKNTKKEEEMGQNNMKRGTGNIVNHK